MILCNVFKHTSNGQFAIALQYFVTQQHPSSKPHAYFLFPGHAKASAANNGKPYK